MRSAESMSNIPVSIGPAARSLNGCKRLSVAGSVPNTQQQDEPGLKVGGRLPELDRWTERVPLRRRLGVKLLARIRPLPEVRSPAEGRPLRPRERLRSYATSRSFWASPSDCSFFRLWFSIW